MSRHRPKARTRVVSPRDYIWARVTALIPFDFLAASAPAALLPSRIQLAFTLAYHIILVPLGVALPLLTVVMEGIGLRRHDTVASMLERRWSIMIAGLV